jgi:hypothetical protein
LFLLTFPQLLEFYDELALFFVMGFLISFATVTATHRFVRRLSSFACMHRSFTIAYTRRFLYRITDPDNNPAAPPTSEQPKAANTANSAKNPDLSPFNDLDEYIKLVSTQDSPSSYLFLLIFTQLLEICDELALLFIMGFLLSFATFTGIGRYGK